MKRSTLALVLAAASLALAFDGAAEPTTVQPSKSNSDAIAAKACTDAGGTVYTKKDGAIVCAMPAGMSLGSKKKGLSILEVTAAQVTTVQSSKSNSSFRTDPAKACTDAGGEVVTDAAGAKFCLMLKPTTPAPAPATPPAPPKVN